MPAFSCFQFVFCCCSPIDFADSAGFFESSKCECFDILDAPGPDVDILKNLLSKVRRTGSVKDPVRSTKRKLSPSRGAEGHDGLCEKSASANEFALDAQHELPTDKRDAAASSSSLGFTPSLKARSPDGMCVGLGTSAALKLSPSHDAEGHDGLCEKSGAANEFDSEFLYEPHTYKRDAAALSSSLDLTPSLEARSLDGMRVGLGTSAALKPVIATPEASIVPQHLCDQASLNDHDDPLLTSVQSNSCRVMAKPSASSSLQTGSETPEVSSCGLGPPNTFDKPFPPGFDACSSASRPKFHGRSCAKDREVQKLLFIELCAGTAILSRTAASAGFRIFPVDNSRKRAPHKSVHLLDLAVPEQQASLIELIRNERDALALLFAAPSCGTASRAREKPLHSWKCKGFAIPQPLRSDDHPDMLPGLSGLDRKEVELANQLYDALSLIMIEAHSLNIPTMIENPANSLYWNTIFFVQLASVARGHFVKFHNCCHGGARPKLTAFGQQLTGLTTLQSFATVPMFINRGGLSLKTGICIWSPVRRLPILLCCANESSVPRCRTCTLQTLFRTPS